MTVENFEVCADDGHRFQATLYRAADESAPLLIFMAAMGTRARYYGNFGAAMAEQGLNFASFDWRGIDSSSLRASRRTNFGYRELLEQDLPAVIATLSQRLPQAPLWIGGHSLGGQLSALYAGIDPDSVRGLVLIACGSVYFRAWQGWRALALLGFTQSTVLVSAAVGHFPGPRFRFGGIEARGVMSDWAGVARAGRYCIRGSRHDYEAAMALLQKPVFALSFQGDRLAPKESMRRLLDKLPQCRRTHLQWGAADTGGVALDHFSWAKRSELVAPAVAAWVLAGGTGHAACDSG